MSGALYLGTTSSLSRVVTEASVPIFLSDLQCDSNVDAHLLSCDSLPHGRPARKCSHEDDVWIHCEGTVAAINPMWLTSVIADPLAHCSEEQSISNYGEYTWPRINHEENSSSMCYYGGPEPNSMATRSCNERGSWEPVNFSDCWTHSESILSNTVSDKLSVRWNGHATPELPIPS